MLAIAPAACGSDAPSDDVTDDNSDCGACDAAPLIDEVILYLHDRGAETMSNADLVAFQDGDGAWQQLVGDGGVYRADSTTGRYGFFIGCVPSYGRGNYRFATTTDSLTQDASSCAPTALPVEISGTLSGGGGQAFYNVSGYADAMYGDASIDAYVLRGAVGPTQVLAEVFSGQTGLVTGVLRADLGDLTTTGQQDFAFANALVPATASTTIDGANADDGLTTWTGINTGDGTLYFSERHPTTAAAPDYQVLPVDLRQPTDTLEVAVYADQAVDGAASYATRSVTHYDADDATTFALPAVRTFPNVVVGDDALSWELPAALALTPAESVTATVFGFSNAFSVYLFADATPRWLAGSNGSLTLGGLAELPGWDPALSIEPAFSWTIYAWSDDATSFTSSGTSGRTSVPSLTAASARAATSTARMQLQRAHQARPHRVTPR